MLFDRPGVAGAVLQTVLSFIHLRTQLVILFLKIFKIPSLLNRKSKGLEILRKCSLPTTCHMSRVGGGSVINGATPSSFRTALSTLYTKSIKHKLKARQRNKMTVRYFDLCYYK